MDRRMHVYIISCDSFLLSLNTILTCCCNLFCHAQGNHRKSFATLILMPLTNSYDSIWMSQRKILCCTGDHWDLVLVVIWQPGVLNQRILSLGDPWEVSSCMHPFYQYIVLYWKRDVQCMAISFPISIAPQ